MFFRLALLEFSSRALLSNLGCLNLIMVSPNVFCMKDNKLGAYCAHSFFSRPCSRSACYCLVPKF